MFNERSALEQLFKSLNQAREIRYGQFLSEIADIERKQKELMENLRRIDGQSHVHEKIVEQKVKEASVANEIKKLVTEMEDKPDFKDKETAESFGMEFEPQQEREPVKPLPKALKPIFEDNKRIWPDGSVQYQCYYICPSCKDRSRVYINSSSLECYCRNCKKKMKTKHATSKGFPTQDMHGNFFVAGEFIREEDRGVLIASNPVDDALKKYEAERAGKEVAATNETAIAAALKESAKFTLG